MSSDTKGAGFNPLPLQILDPDTEKLVEAVIEELKKRNATHDYCPRCGTLDWNVDPVAISVIPLRGIPAALPHAYFPAHIMAVQIVCKNCGYTMFHNLNVLGLAQTPRR
jgi:predicted nucleic-acid-binding Zn-ribbon protein